MVTYVTIGESMQKMYEDIKGRIVSFKKDDVIVNEGDICNNIYYVIEGEVSIYTYSHQDNIYLIRQVREKQVFAQQLIFASNNHFLGSVIANKKTTIKIISKNTLLDHLANKEFLELYLNNISNNFLYLQNRLKVLSQRSIKEKLLFYLEKKAKTLNSKKIYITSKKDLAQYLNIPRPSLSRELINLQKQGLITYERHYIILK